MVGEWRCKGGEWRHDDQREDVGEGHELGETENMAKEGKQKEEQKRTSNAFANAG
jgi:hypothetical protein